MVYTYRDVRASYGGAKALQERHDLMFRFFARPLSFPIAWLALSVGLAPNHVTYISLLLNIGGLGMMASGSRLLMAWGVVTVLVALVLDATDGNMARTAKRFSPLGEWLEGVGAYLLQAAFHLCGGIGAWLAFVRGTPVTAWPGAQEWSGALVAAGAVAAAAITLTTLVAAKFSMVFPSVDRGKVVARAGDGIYGQLFTLGRNLSFSSGLVLPLTLIGVLLRRYELVLGSFALLNLAILLTVTGRCVWLALHAMRSPEGVGAGTSK